MTKATASKSKNTTIKLRNWCQQQLAARDQQVITDFSALSGDASFRKYYRVSTATGTFIAVFAPPKSEKNKEFIAIATLLGDAGLRVPEVVAADLTQGFFLQSDLGDTLLLSELQTGNVEHWYGQALAALSEIQQIDAQQLPSYSGEQMREDLQRFPEWFASGLLDSPLDASEIRLFDDFCAQLIESALAQPQVLTHYDYQSRNLMVCQDSALGIIDFQDALRAPMTYDLVSILRDCYVKWPLEDVLRWATGFAESARSQGLLVDTVSTEQFLHWFDMMSLQRHVRVLGTFARLHLRDNKPGYLGDIPMVCEYVQEVAAQNASTEAFSHWFSSTIMPRVSQQPWFKAAVGETQ